MCLAAVPNCLAKYLKGDIDDDVDDDDVDDHEMVMMMMIMMRW